MRAARLLPLLPLLLLLLGVSSQDVENSAHSTQNPTTKATEPPTTTMPAGTSPLTSAPSSTPAHPITTTIPPTTTQPSVVKATTAESITTPTTNAGSSPSPTAMAPITASGATPTALRATSPATTTPSHRQDSPSHSTNTPITIPDAGPSTPSQQLSNPTASSGSSGATTTGKPVLSQETSSPGAVGAAGTSLPSTQPQGNQPLDRAPNTTVSATVPRTDPSQSSKDCVVSPPLCTTKEPPSSSSPVQGPTPSTSPGSISDSPPIGSSSLPTTPTSQPGSKDMVPEAATTRAPGADQSTHGNGSASAKPSSASQSPSSAQPSTPAPGNQTDQTGSCSPGHQQPNISFPNELICKDQMQNISSTIQLKESRTCDEWRNASRNNNSFYESFCSTAQHAFDASRDRCTVTLMASKPRSHHWAVGVVLHTPLDSEEVLKELKEKKDKLDELGIVNITSEKMVEDMTINNEFSTPLIITIITLAGSLLLVAAIYGCHQRFSQKKDQNIHPDVPGFDDGHVALIFNRLTEEMQTMENGYHDNPTLEVMETSSEMQEKKVNLNGELGDSWIVPLDTLTKEDLEEEEDTHL